MRHTKIETVKPKESLCQEVRIGDKYRGIIITVDDGKGNPVQTTLQVCVPNQSETDWVPLYKRDLVDMPRGDSGTILEKIGEYVQVTAINTTTETNSMRLNIIKYR
jgi:hypothetical protein